MPGYSTKTPPPPQGRPGAAAPSRPPATASHGIPGMHCIPQHAPPSLLSRRTLRALNYMRIK